MMQPCGKLYGDSSKKLNTESPYDLAVTSRYTIKRNEAGTQTGVCATMFGAALFTMAKKVETTNMSINR